MIRDAYRHILLHHLLCVPQAHSRGGIYADDLDTGDTILNDVVVGNLDENNKAFIVLTGYPNRRRIKLWGIAEIVDG